MSELEDAQEAYNTAYYAWKAELRRSLGEAAANTFYSKEHEGTPGTALHDAYKAYIAAGIVWATIQFPTERRSYTDAELSSPMFTAEVDVDFINEFGKCQAHTFIVRNLHWDFGFVGKIKEGFNVRCLRIYDGDELIETRTDV